MSENKPENDPGADGTKFLILLMVISLIAGGLVLVVKSDYRVKDNLLSNIEYYPHIKQEKGTD